MKDRALFPLTSIGSQDIYFDARGGNIDDISLISSTMSGPGSIAPTGNIFSPSSGTVIDSVPAYDWYHGCGPTAAASIIGYWDLQGYSNLFDADNDDVFLTGNVQDQISSPEHNAKYNPTPDDSSLPIPSANSIADWFQTSVDPLNYGWSYLSYADDAFTGYADYRGYEFEAVNQSFNNQLWDTLVSEIDSGRPAMFLVDTNGDGGTDHFVPVLGYDDRGSNGQYYGLYTTWSEDESIVWKPFKGLGNSWGVGYATLVKPVDNPTTSPDLLFSINKNAKVNGLTVKKQDILQFDGEEFKLFFDGSDVKLGNRKITAFDVISDTEVLLSIDKTKTLPGAGKVTPYDVVKFTATKLGSKTRGKYSMYFNGKDVGLTAKGERIDALTGLKNGDLLLSTDGTLLAKGGYRAPEEDITQFHARQLGKNTKGRFTCYFDGSDVGLGKNDINAFSLANNQDKDLIFSTTASFNRGALSARREDALSFAPTTLGSRTRGNFASDVFFDGSQFGLGGDNLLGVDVTFNRI